MLARIIGSTLGTMIAVFVLQVLAGHESGQITTFDDIGQFWSEYVDYQSYMIDSIQESFSAMDSFDSGHPEMDPPDFDSDYSE